MNRIDRLFGILTLLQSKKYVPGEKIADKFGISIRTVYRDISALNEQGIPVSFEPHKGYFVVNGYFLPPVSFSSDEANALLLVEQLVNGFADQSIRKLYSGALDKVKSVLRTTQKESLEKLGDTMKLQRPARLEQDYNYLSIMQHAISSQKILEIGYKNNMEEVSRRTIEPIGLIFYAFGWHLIAWCHLRNDYRDFKVSRLTSLNILDRPFEKQEHIAIGDYMKLLPVNY